MDQKLYTTWLCKVQMLLAMLLLTALTACESYNPFGAAETLEQQAFAVEASYNIALQSALDLVEDPAVPLAAKQKILDAELVTTPVVNSLSTATNEYIVAKTAFEAGTTTEEQLLVIPANLEKWVTAAETAVADLTAIINSVGDG